MKVSNTVTSKNEFFDVSSQRELRKKKDKSMSGDMDGLARGYSVAPAGPFSVELLCRVLLEYYPACKPFFIEPACIVFQGIALRFRGAWVIIGDNSHPCGDIVQLLEVLEAEKLISRSEHNVIAIPNRYNKLLTN